MMINRQSNGLKGQHNLAQGKRSVALGWIIGIKIVRAKTFIEVLSLLRTKKHEFQFPACGWQASEKRLRLDLCLCADGLLFIFFTPGVALG